MSNNSTTDKAVKGAHSQTAVVVIRGILSLVYFSIMSRLLTPADFGYFALITAVTTILGSLSEAGLGSSVIQKKQVCADYVSTAYTLSIILGLIFGLILFSGARIFSDLVAGSDHLTLAFRLMSIILLSQSINNIGWALYMRQLDFFKYGIVQINSEILSYLIGIILAYKGYGYYAIVAVAICSQLFLTCTLFILGKIKFKFIIIREYVKEIIDYGGWLTLSVIVRNLTNEIDKIIIGRFLSITDLGAINRPQGFVSRINSNFNGIFDTVLFPILSGIQSDKEKISRAYIKIVSLIMTFSIILAGFLTVGARMIIDIFFGNQWGYLQPILVIFAFGTMIHGFSRIADSFFRSLGIVKLYFYARIINWIVFIIAVCIGCQFGLYGAAIGIVAGSFISCVIKYLMQKNYVNVKTHILISEIANNIAFPLLIIILIVGVNSIFNLSDYIVLVAYMFILGTSMIFFPRFFGKVFQETIINRYLNKLRRFRIY